MVYDCVDFAMEQEGDFVISQDGDILDTAFDPLLGFVHAIHNRIKHFAGDWKLYKDLGLSYAPFGDLNTEETALAWEEALTAALVQDGTVDAGDLSLTTTPLQDDVILTLIEINVEPTEYNGGTNKVQIYSVFDMNKRMIDFY